MTRRAKLQKILDNAVNNGLSVSDLATRLRSFSKGGGSGIESALTSLLEATSPVDKCEDKVAKAQAQIAAAEQAIAEAKAALK